MLAILKKEFNSFFASPVAYLVIGIFLTINGLYLWVFKGQYNILNAGFADLNAFFYITPWLFLFLIPAITMKSFADEFNTGTIEILKTASLTDWKIIFGKFFASLTLVCLAIIPTLTYVYAIWKLGNPKGNIDLGSILGSYLGVLFLATSYISIGLFTSTLHKNQIIAFVLGTSIMFLFLFGFDAIGNLSNNYTIKLFGINEHFKSISRGVIDSRDIIYFISIDFLFLYLTKNRLQND